MNPDEIIQKMESKTRENPENGSVESVYYKEDIKRTLTSVCEYVNLLETLLEGRLPYDHSFLEKPINSLHLNSRIKHAIAMLAARDLSKTRNVNMMDILLLGRNRISQYRNVGDVSLKELDEYLRIHGINRY